jgi:hypothetical protein
MTLPETFPQIENCIDLYLAIHDRYGTEMFHPDALAGWLDTHDSVDLPADVHFLDLLVAYGLLARHHDGRYRVRCAPDEDLDRWRTKAAIRVESLYQRVHRVTGSSPTGSTDEHGRERLQHDGEAFVSLRVTHPDDLDSTSATLRTVLDEHPECVGIVFRSPGELAAEVQRFTDGLCDLSMTATGERTFEKVTTELVGDHKDDLEFRLFLRETT